MKRREFFKTAGAGMAAASFSSAACVVSREEKTPEGKQAYQWQLGMASYTFREFSLDDTLTMTKRLGLKRIAFKSFHLPLESTESEIRAIAAKVKQEGLDLYGCGVIYMKSEEEVLRAFDYAGAAGIKVIIGVPNPEFLELVDQKVKEYDIKVAIHNHGPTDNLYPTPQSAYERIKELDKRIGLCIDIGHTKRAGVNPSESAKNFSDRLIDIHIKDVTAAEKDGTTVEIGRGVIDIPDFLQTLINIDYKGTASFEFEKDSKDPLPGVAESVGYVRGVLSVI
ncbi:MAG: sugar phosphate isomerase/epimerase [Candidatus Aminicenantes bacterium]|nr:sugar phosphate isomerase/epimerase [Candidatus Aminicenantes bacterium]